MSKFKVGDVVRLKSGGPNMTCAKASFRDTNYPTMICQWFDGNKMWEDFFPVHSLVLIERPEDQSENKEEESK